MLAAIRHGLSNLFNFAGRDARQAFWYYVLFVYLVTTAITMAVMLPMMLQGFVVGMQQGMAAAQSGDPAAAQAATQIAMGDAMSGMMGWMTWAGVGANLLMLLALAAALVRRLHDSALSGAWALLPAALQLIGTALAPGQYARMLQQMEVASTGTGFPGMASIFGASALIGYAAIGATVVLAVRKSTPGPNRFGETPFVA